MSSTNLINVIADIREKTGVGARPTLSELADAIAALIPRWRPFETVPRDGSRVLATGGGLYETVEIVSYNERIGCWDAESCTLEDGDHDAQGYNRPERWMPLPASAPLLAKHGAPPHGE